MTILALRSTSARRLLWTAYAVALAWWLLRLSWLIGVTPPGYVALAAYQAIYLPLTLLLVRWLHQRYRAATVLTLPLAWVSLEFLRCILLEGGFPWFALGHTQAPYLPHHAAGRLIQTADLFGQYGVSFLVAMTNGLIVDVLSRPLLAPGAGGKRRPGRGVLAAAAVWAAALGGAWGYGQYRLLESPARGYVPPPLRVAVIQTNVPQDVKLHPTWEDVVAYWERMVDLTRDAVLGAAEGRPDLIVWPETMVPAALNAETLEYYRTTAGGARGMEVFHQEIADLARQLRVHLLVGADAAYDWQALADPQGQPFMAAGRRYNSVYLYHPDGTQSPRRYDKVHRVPFGEYVPWVGRWPGLKMWFIRLLTPYDFDFDLAAGEEFTIFEVPPASPSPRAAAAIASPARIAAPICFEDAQPAVTRQMVYRAGGSKDADFLVNLTNDGWYPGTHQGPQHFQIAVLRCVETRVPMARAVNTGVSGFIDSNGRVTRVVEHDGRRQLIDGWEAQEVTFDSRRTVFGRVGHAPIWALVALTTLLGVGAAFRKGSH